jgi:hypothetical protein
MLDRDKAIEILVKCLRDALHPQVTEDAFKRTVEFYAGPVSKDKKAQAKP